jgi:AcrR family transcriptional regulator
MKKAEKTRSYIIEQTAEIFNKKGYAATSLSDITKATGLTKGSIYGNFESKEEVAIAVFEHLANFVHNAVLHALNKDYPSQRDRLVAVTDLYRNGWSQFFVKGGCPLLNAAAEADDTFPELKKYTSNAFERWAKEIVKVIDAGVRSGEFNEDINAKDYAYLFIMLIEGGILLSKTHNRQNHLHKALDRIIKIIDDEIVA